MASNTTTNFWIVDNGDLIVTVRGINPITYIGGTKINNISVISVGTPLIFSSREYRDAYLKSLSAQELKVLNQQLLKSPTNYNFTININNDQYKVRWQDVTMGNPFDQKIKVTPEKILGFELEERSTPESVYQNFIKYLQG